MNKTKSPSFFYGYIVVLAAIVITVVGWVMMNAYGVFFEPMLTEFGWTRAVTSGPYSLYIIVQGLLSIVMGKVNDRFGSRAIIIVCGFSFSLGYFLMSRISNVWQLYLFFGVLAGIGMAGVWVPLLSTVAKWFVRRRGLMCGVVTAGTTLSMAIMPLLASWLISIYGWRDSYAIFAVITLVVFIAGGLFLKRDPAQIGLSPYGEDEVESVSSEAWGLSLSEAIRTRQFWMFTVLATFVTLLSCLILVHIVIHAIDFGVPAIIAASVMTASGVAGIPGSIGLGYIADRISSRRTLIIIIILFTVGSLWLLVADELWMLYLFAVIFGLAYGGFFTVESPVLAELFGLTSHGTIFGAIYFITMIGGATGPVLAGYIFDITGSYLGAFLTCVVLSTISLILALLLKPIRR